MTQSGDEAVRKEFEAESDKFAVDFVDVFGGFPKDQAISLNEWQRSREWRN